MRPVRSPLPHLLLLVTLLLPLPPGAISTAAQDDPLQAGTKTVNVELILDSSASMSELLPEGETRLDAAKRILRQVINDLPEREGINVGLRVYGHEGDNSEAGKAVSCGASELLVPVAGLDKAALIAQVEAIQPTGWTPIAYSLEQAAADFQPGGESVTNAIVLVTDGEETCDPPEESCSAAAALHQADVSVVTHVVGFALTPEQTELVSCVAEEGGGQLFDAEDAAELGTALTEVLQEVGIPPAPGALAGIHTLAYHQLTAWDVAADHGAEGPVLSDDGQRIVFARSPGLIGTSGESNRIFVINADGSGEREVDAYTSRCCPSVVDLSSDGASIVSTDGAQLRIAKTGGGGGRQLIALNGGGIDGLRISADGSRVYFRVAQNDPLPLERGIWVINADGTRLRQIVGPAQMEALGLPPDHSFSTLGWGLDVSADGSRLVFGASHLPGGGEESVFIVSSDGSGLRELVEPGRYVENVAISGDGSTVAYHIRDANDLEQVSVIGFDGSNQRTLADGTTLHPASAGIYVLGYPTDRLGLSGNGSRLLLGSTGVLYDTSGGGRLALGVVDGGAAVVGHGPLVREGLYRATMSADASRVIYLAFHADAPHQLARVDINPAELGPAPAISEASVTPPYVLTGNRTPATASARVSGTEPLGVGGRVLYAGLPDLKFPTYTLYDDGASRGDAAADGLFTNNGLATADAVLGPRTVRVKAETIDTDGLLHATAVDVTPFAVVDDFPPEEPVTPATPVTPVTGTPVTGTPTTDTDGELPAAFVGMWEGTAVDATTDEQVLLELELSGGAAGADVGTYFYPTAECGGLVTLQEVAADGSQVTLTERFGFTSFTPCPTGADATVTLTPRAGGMLGYAWTDPGSGRSRSGALAYQDEYGRFVGALAAREGRPGADPDRLAGPLSGELVLACCESTTAGAGVTVENFVASATFTTPTEPAANPMGVGFAFRRTPEMVEQLSINWGGGWHYWPAPEGNVTARDIRTAWGAGLPFDGTPGSMTTIDLVVDGETALFGVNGLFVAKIELLHPIAAGDVEVAAFWSSRGVPGTTIEYTDFQVWTPPVVTSQDEPAATPLPAAGTEPGSTPPPAETAGELPATFLGGWEGISDELPSNAQVPVTVDLTGGNLGAVVGTMALPNHACGGDLRLQSVAADGRHAELAVEITYGHAVCILGGIVTLTLQTDTSLSYDWRHPTVHVTATGTLMQTNGGILPQPSTVNQDTLQVHFALSGGIAGYQDELALDTADLPEAEASELRRLIEEADFWNLPEEIDDGVPVTDGFQYRVTVSDGSRGQTVAAYDGDGRALAQYPSFWTLLGWLVKHIGTE